MAKLCLNCFNKINETNYSYKDVQCDMDICENCKTNDYCVIAILSEDDNFSSGRF